MGGKWRRTEHGFYLLCVPEGSFIALKLRFKTSRDKLISTLSYTERNGVEVGVQLSSGLLGIKIKIPAGMDKASVILEKIDFCAVYRSWAFQFLAWIHWRALPAFRPQHRDHLIGSLYRREQPLKVITAMPSFPGETKWHRWETRAWLGQLVGQNCTGLVHFLLWDPCQSLKPNLNQLLKRKGLFSTVDKYLCCSYGHVTSAHNKELNLTGSFRNRPESSDQVVTFFCCLR